MDAFETPQNNIDWARQCLDRGREAFRIYAHSNSFIHVAEHDPETGDEVRKVVQIKPLPDEVGHYFRNALVDLKHSFDQSLFAAAKKLGFHRFKKNYPWADSPAGLRATLGKRQTDKDSILPDILIEEIWRQEPYATGPSFSGGNDLIREVAQMVNDKHTIGFVSVPIVASMRLDNFMVSTRNRGPDTGVILPEFIWDPVNKEMILGRVRGGAKILYDDPQVSIQVLFERTGLLEDVSAPVAIRRFADRAQFVLEGFKRVCAQAQ